MILSPVIAANKKHDPTPEANVPQPTVKELVSKGPGWLKKTQRGKPSPYTQEITGAAKAIGQSDRTKKERKKQIEGGNRDESDDVDMPVAFEDEDFHVPKKGKGINKQKSGTEDNDEEIDDGDEEEVLEEDEEIQDINKESPNNNNGMQQEDNDLSSSENDQESDEEYSDSDMSQSDTELHPQQTSFLSNNELGEKSKISTSKSFDLNGNSNKRLLTDITDASSLMNQKKIDIKTNFLSTSLLNGPPLLNDSIRTAQNQSEMYQNRNIPSLTLASTSTAVHNRIKKVSQFLTSPASDSVYETNLGNLNSLMDANCSIT